jgi:hypothetical protein
MGQLQIAYLPRRGTQERWRRLCQDVAELRPEQFAAVCQQAGITQVQVRLLQLLHSELLLVTVQMQEPQQAHEALASSQAPLAHWLREQLQGLLGWDVQEVLSDPPADLLLTWEGEGDDECTETEKTVRHRSPPPGMAMEDDTSTKGGPFNDCFSSDGSLQMEPDPL